MAKRIVAVLLLALAALRAEELTPQTLDAWIERISPRPDELRWREVPWRPVFADAVVEAEEAGRPLLIWAMNGHPLGCT